MSDMPHDEKRDTYLAAGLVALLWLIFLCGFCEEHLTVRTSSWWGACEEVEDRLRDCRHARLRRRFRDLFFPSRCFEAAGLEESVGDHCHQGMSTSQALMTATSILRVVSAGRFDT